MIEGSETMNRRIVCLLLSVLLFTVSPAQAQQPPKSPRIGFLSAGSPSTIAARIDALREGLRELGYVEGKNILIEWRFAEGKPDRLPALMTELVRLNVDVIVSAGGQHTRPAKEATTTIPIVMAQDTDPVGNGFVATLARPGGNITGLSSFSGAKRQTSRAAKRCRTEALPLSRDRAVNQTGNAQALKESELAAGALKVQCAIPGHIRIADIESVFRDASKGRADGFLVLQSPILSSHRKQHCRSRDQEPAPGDLLRPGIC